MTKRNSIHPTESELEILQVLWEHGPVTVRFVNEILNNRREVGYTTTLKIMQIMTEKKLVKREKRGRSHLYRAVQKAPETRRMLLNQLKESAFGGSVMKLVMQALGNYDASPAEIEQIRELLAEKERNPE